MPGVEVSTGSLGHGIGVAVGMAMAAKKQAVVAQTRTRQVVTLIGDGEANEGSVWEAVMVAADQALDNLKIIYDADKSQIRCLQLPDPAARFAAFGCAVQSVDGHDVAAHHEDRYALLLHGERCFVLALVDEGDVRQAEDEPTKQHDANRQGKGTRPHHAPPSLRRI